MTITECHTLNCHRDKTMDHLLMECQGSVEMWTRVKTIGPNTDIHNADNYVWDIQ